MKKDHIENMDRGYMRSSAIKARNALTEEERIERSARICRKVFELPEYHKAKTVMLYKWTRGEVKLDELEEGGAFHDGHKTLLYPLCMDDGIMVAIRPGGGEDSWALGAFGITEPVREKGEVIQPEKIDLIICPVAGFDEKLNRLGMGSGYYDRFLPLCTKAAKIGVAFEVQRLDAIPAEPHDIKMDMVITETHAYD